MRLTTGVQRAVALFMLALYAALLIAGLDLVYWDGYSPGSGFAPVWVAISGIILAGMMLVDFGGDEPDDLEDGVSFPSGAEFKRVFMVLSGLWLFVVLTPIIGMISTSFIFVFVMLSLTLERPPFFSLMTAIITSVMIYYIFIYWMDVQLPRGPFGF